MSKNDQPDERHTFETSFVDLIDANQTRDVGISEFEQKMLDDEVFLSKKYVGQDLYDHEELQDIEQALEDNWHYSGSIGIVSGRVYVIGSSFDSMFPHTWGAPQKDTAGNEYFFLENESLLSQGVDVTAVCDQNNKTTAIKIGYVFALHTDDMNDDPSLIAYPGELSRHQYETPTPAEAALRLSRKWPDQFKLLRHLVKPDLEMSLPRRIGRITERFQAQLIESEEFRTLLEIYLDDTLSLNQEHPYVITTDKEILCYEGVDTPYEEDSEGAWTRVILKNPLSVLVYTPMVRSFLDGNGNVTLNIAGQIFNMHDKDDPEYVRFDVTLLSQFRSTLAQRALLDRVMNLTLPDSGEDHLPEVVNNINTFIDGDIVPAEVQHSDTSEEIREMMMLEKELELAKGVIKDAASILYSTEEEALEASRALMGGQLSNMLYGAGIMNEYRFVFSGSTVLLPNTVENILNEKPNMFVYELDSEQKLYTLENGDVIEGNIETLFASTKREYDSKGTIIGYRVDPCVAAYISEKKTIMAGSGKELALAEISVTTRALVPLDGSSEMKIKLLEIYRATNNAMKNANEAYGTHAILVSLQSLRTELQGEEKDSFVSLENKNLFNEIANNASTLTTQRMQSSAAVEALEAFLVDRGVEIVGESYTIDGLFIDMPKDSFGRSVIRGTVIDIDDNPSRQGLNVVIMNGEGGSVYVPFSTIKDFRF